MFCFHCFTSAVDITPEMSQFLRSINDKTIIRFGFCDIQNNQGLGKGYQPQPSASVDNRYLDFDYSGYHKNLIQ